MRQYEMYEMEYVVNGNIQCVFYSPSGIKTEVKGFYAGKDLYRIRFLPNEVGEYRFIVNGKIKDSGTLWCERASSKKHGVVRAKDTHFQYADGTWFYPFGTTIYAMIHQTEELRKLTMIELIKSEFNKVRMCVFPKYYDYNHNEPECFPFVGSMDNICIEYWNKLDELIAQMNENGIECDLILFHPYDRWGFSKLSVQEAKRYLEYAVSRLAAHPNLWWSLANEFDIMDYEVRDWEEFASFVAEEDPYHHLLSNHNCIGYWDFNNRDTSHICLQIKDVSIVAKMIDEYKKPLMVDECCYEGDLTHEWGNISGFEMVDRFWRTVVQGGYCTHGETYENEEEILWWSKGGRLRGESPIRITFLKKIVESFPGPLVYCGEEFTKEKYEELCAHPEKIENDFWRSVTRAPWWRAKEALLPGKEYVGHVSEEIYLRYMERKCANKTILNLPLTFLYDVYLLDVWEMTQEKVLESVNGYTEVMLPSKEGMAVLARAKRSIDK